jgi:hypothetical protein
MLLAFSAWLSPWPAESSQHLQPVAQEVQDEEVGGGHQEGEDDHEHHARREVVEVGAVPGAAQQLHQDAVVRPQVPGSGCQLEVLQRVLMAVNA